MKADITFSNDRKTNDFNILVKAQTNLGFVKAEYDKELRIKIFWGIPLKPKKKDAGADDSQKKEKDRKQAEDKTKENHTETEEAEEAKKAKETNETNEKKTGAEKSGKGNLISALANNVDGVKSALVHVVNMLKRCRIKMKDTDLAFSAGSPDINGLISAALAMIPAVYQTDVRLKPDFASEEIYIDGHANVHIRIYTFKILIELIKTLLDKDVLKLIEELKG